MSESKRPGRRSIVRRAKRPSVGEKRPRKVIRRAPRREAPVEIEPALVSRPGRRAAIAMAVVVMGLFVAGGVWLWQSPLLRVQEVEIVGNTSLDSATILARLDVEGESMFTIDLGAAESRVGGLAQVSSVHIEQMWPDMIAVTITEREPWGTWEQAGGEYTVDREGVVLSRQPAAPGSPVVRSSQPFTLQPGDRVDYQALEAASEIYAQLPQALGTQVSEVAYLAGKGVQVTTASGQTALLGDSSGIAYKLAVWASVEEEAAQSGLVYSTIDLRYGNRPVLQ